MLFSWTQQRSQANIYKIDRNESTKLGSSSWPKVKWYCHWSLRWWNRTHFINYQALSTISLYQLSAVSIPVAAPPGRSHLRSAASGDLYVPATFTKTIGPRGFFHADPPAWNCLPPSMKDPNITFSSFKKLLKTELFQPHKHWT